VKRARFSFSCLLLGLVVLSALTGCESDARKHAERARAFEQGRQQGLQEAEEKNQPVVLFRGDVRNPRVPWKEGITLAQALLVAQYTWSWDPRSITVTRDGQTYTINPRRFLRGQEDPELEPGDVVEVRH
jgi:hypothetical protein